MLFMALAITIISQIIISCNNDKDEENNSIEDDMTITGVENGHEYVDLGLSVSWATCNIGAKNPYENGSYYIGLFKNGIPHGEGRMYEKNDNNY